METVKVTEQPNESKVKGSSEFLNLTARAIDDIFDSFDDLVKAVTKWNTREVIRAYWRLGSPRRWAFLLPGGGALTGAKVTLPNEVKAEAVADTKPAPPPPPAPKK